MGDYPVSLSIIRALSKIAKRFSAVMCESPKKPIFLKFFGPELFSLLIKLSILLLAHLAQSNRRLSWRFEHHQSNAVKVRNDLVQ